MGAVKSAIQPYLFFDGNCEEAIKFYQSILGAKVEMLMRYKDNPTPPPKGIVPEGYDEKVMHASFTIRGSSISAADGCHKGNVFSGFSLSLTIADIEESKQVFKLLSEGGSIQMPLSATFYSPSFGMLTDKFGVRWMVIVPAEMPA